MTHKPQRIGGWLVGKEIKLPIKTVFVELPDPTPEAGSPKRQAEWGPKEPEVASVPKGSSVKPSKG